MIEALAIALVTILTPLNMLILLLAVLFGLFIGVVPGLGGIVGLSLALPFVLHMAPETAVLCLIGLGAVVATSDTIPAVMLGVPGSAGAQATILDGFPMAKKGEAGRALGAAYASSMLGGVFGALCLFLMLPVLRPLVLTMGSPEFFMVAMVGLVMIGTLTGRQPLVGIAAGLLGILASMVGLDPQVPLFYRWTFGLPYLADGLPLVPAILGLFAIPELLDLIRSRQSIAQTEAAVPGARSVFTGIRDALRHWLLVLRCSALGVFVGFVPGMGASVVDWLAYGFAKNTCRNSQTFGQGDVRGVIAPESANNAKEGGALMPTIAFGVPGSASMVILLGAFTMFGIVPGPGMITDNLPITLTMVWGLALANLLGGGICLLCSSHIARLAHVRIGLLAPLVLVTVFLAVLQTTVHIGDLIVFLVFGLLGVLFKKLDWPRPPLILGIVLGPIVRKYYAISMQSYGWSWLGHPGVLLVGILLVITLIYAGLALKRQWSEAVEEIPSNPQRLRRALAATIGMTVLFVLACLTTGDWPESSRIPLLVVAIPGVLFSVLQTANFLGFLRKTAAADPSVSPEPFFGGKELRFLGWIGGYFLSTWLVGQLWASLLFLGLYLGWEQKESWRVTVPTLLGVYVFFAWVLGEVLHIRLLPGVLF